MLKSLEMYYASLISDFDVETIVLTKTIEPYDKVAVLPCSTLSANPSPKGYL